MNVELLRKLDLFQDLDALQVAHVASIAREERVTKNGLIFDEGDPATAFYVIAEGRVRISKVVPGFGEEALAILESGTYLGEMELMEPELTRAARAVAHEDCVLHVITIDDFHTMLRANPELGYAMLLSFVKTLSFRLRATDDKVAAFFAMAQFG